MRSFKAQLVLYGLVPSLVVHALVLTAVYLSPQREKPKPPCPTREEVCRHRCDARPIHIPAHCPVQKPCRCDDVMVELAEPELLLPPPAAEPPPIAEPPPVAEPPPPVETQAVEEPPAASKKASRKAARKKAEKVARSASIAKVLGTYGGENSAVFDVLESGDTRLDGLFDTGITTADSEGKPKPAGGRIAGIGATVEESERKPETLSSVVRRKRTSLRECYSRALVEAGVAGKLRVTLTVDDTGKPTAVTVDRDTTGSDTLRDCVVEQVEGWRLPAGLAGETRFAVVFSTEE